MKMLAAALLFAAPVGCSPADSGKETDAQRAAGAEFRAVARETYASLDRPSCSAPKGFVRAEHLRPEREALSAFERRMASRPGGAQLALARADAAYRTGCWSDIDPAFAKIHVEMTRKDVASGIAKLDALAARLGDVEAVPAPPQAAAFRQGVRELMQAIYPLCTLSATVPDAEITASAGDRVANFRAQLGDTPWARHYAIAEADAAYARSVTLVECGIPSAEPAAALRDELLAEVRAKIAALDALRR